MRCSSDAGKAAGGVSEKKVMQSATSSSHEGASLRERQSTASLLGSQAAPQEGGQDTLADAANPEEGDQAAALLHDPLGELGHFHLAAGEVTHVECTDPVHTGGGGKPRECRGDRRLGRWGKLNGQRWSLHHSSGTGLFDRGRYGRWPGQYGCEPTLIEKHPLTGRFPQGADLRFLPLWCKNVLLHTQRKKVLQMGGFGIVAAGLPLADGAAGDPQQVGQAGLRQANARAQLEHDLPKGIVELTIRVPRHQRALCLPRDPAAPNQECEATGKKHAT